MLIDVKVRTVTDKYEASIKLDYATEVTIETDDRELMTVLEDAVRGAHQAHYHPENLVRGKKA
jgi:hypothetical protein